CAKPCEPGAGSHCTAEPPAAACSAASICSGVVAPSSSTTSAEVSSTTACPACATIAAISSRRALSGATIATRRTLAGFLLPTAPLMLLPRARCDEQVQRQHLAAANQPQHHCPAYAG